MRLRKIRRVKLTKEIVNAYNVNLDVKFRLSCVINLKQLGCRRVGKLSRSLMFTWLVVRSIRRPRNYIELANKFLDVQVL